MRFLSGSKILYFVTLFFVTLSAGLIWLDAFRVFEAELSILVKERVALETDAASALADIAGTLRFAEALSEAPGLSDLLPAGASSDARKNAWQERMSADASAGGVVTVRLRAESSEEARLLASSFVKEFLATSSRYYDIEREIDVKVIDGPLSATAISTPVLYALVSLLSGFLITTLFFAALFGFGKIARPLGKKTEEPTLPIGEAVPWIDPSKFVPVKPRALAYDEADEVGSSVNEDASDQTASAPIQEAPANLPVMDEIPAFEFENAPEEETVSENSQEESAPQGEPSAEEYKRRLNELLRGKNL